MPAAEVEAVVLETADVFLYLVNLTDKLAIDPVATARQKLLINSGKYPVERSRGTSKKYTEL